MLSKIKNRKEKGFTIIEVLIVLAIAGLILLVVFLAVPALQRNARNTQRKNDVAKIMGGISEFVNNNNGTLPGAVSASGNTLTLGASGTNQVPVSLGFFAASDVTLTTFAANGANNNTTVDQVFLVSSAKCDPAAANIGKPMTASSRSIVAVFTVEQASKQCSES